MKDQESLAGGRNDGSCSNQIRCIAFEGYRCIASGGLTEVARKAKGVMDKGGQAPALIFDEVTSRLIEIDFRGTPDEVVERLARSEESATPVSETPERRGPGRPKLGVVAREVTLLPRHWEWLNGQPGGASVALRRLVEEAKRASHGKDRARQSQESVHRFMYVVAGNLPGFEEASRAFYAGNQERFDEIVESWPQDVRDHARKLVSVAFRDAASARE